VVGVGTHADLLERSETYREIVESQASLEEVA
jgi:ATP-binding cassette subfamily B protein